MTRGAEFALVDDDDFDRVVALGSWRVSNGYAVHQSWSKNRPTTIYMHRFVLGLRKGDPQVDHRNRNKLDNTRANLRYPVTDAENKQNLPSYRNGRSQHRGVSWCKQTQRWRATIKVAGKQIHLGRFDTETEAAAAAAAARRERMPFSEDAAA